MEISNLSQRYGTPAAMAYKDKLKCAVEVCFHPFLCLLSKRDGIGRNQPQTRWKNYTKDFLERHTLHRRHPARCHRREEVGEIVHLRPLRIMFWLILSLSRFYSLERKARNARKLWESAIRPYSFGKLIWEKWMARTVFECYVTLFCR